MRQRTARHQEATRATLKKSALAQLLLQLWSWGLMSPQTLQTIMAKAQEDVDAAVKGELDRTDFDKLAAIGAGGRCSHNALRDLSRTVQTPPLQDALIRFEVPLRSQFCRFVVEQREQYVALPHVSFAVLYKEYRHAWQNVFLGEPGKLEKFWEDMSSHPGLQSHPVKLLSDWRRRAIPLSIHGDGTPVAGVGKAWARMMDTYSFCSLLARGTTLDFTVWIYSVFVSLLVGESMDHVMRVICWSFKALASGLWPEADPWGRRYADHSPGSLDSRRAGTQLADGYCGIVWVVRGDLDYFANTLHLHHHAAARPCSWCPCNSVAGDPMAWSEFRRGISQWPSELWSDEEWREVHPNRHQLLQLPGVGISMVYPDHMHSKSMGTDGYTYGSVLWLLVYQILPGSIVQTPNGSLTTLNPKP